jgi:ubiquitin-like 1-activating enzyme E1 A
MRTSSSSSAGGSTSCGSGSSNGNAEIINEISEDEAQIYDRQIRLWGLEAQNRLRKSSILLVGMGGLGAEVSKNLMLSGLKSLTLLDDKEVSFIFFDKSISSQFKVSEADYTSQFMIPRDSLIKNVGFYFINFN